MTISFKTFFIKKEEKKEENMTQVTPLDYKDTSEADLRAAQARSANVFYNGMVNAAQSENACTKMTQGSLFRSVKKLTFIFGYFKAFITILKCISTSIDIKSHTHQPPVARLVLGKRSIVRGSNFTYKLVLVSLSSISSMIDLYLCNSYY